jgi:phosphoribosylaminoimidazole carboxylase
MLVASASLLNLDVTILDVGAHAPAKQIYNHEHPRTHIDGSFSDASKITQLASQVDILTVEIEHVNVDVLEQIERDPFGARVEIHPSTQTLRTIQDKYRQKEHLRLNHLPVAEYAIVESTNLALEEAIQTFGLPLMLKSRTLAYDGRGNFVVRSADDVQDALMAMGNRPLYAEKWASFVKEVAVMVVRTIDGNVVSYPAVETVHKDSICHLVFAPLRGVGATLEENARKLAEHAVKTFTGAGVFGVELFLMSDGELGQCTIRWNALTLNPYAKGSLLINEIAPRPHNSGHYTIEACCTSQYENHLRAILNLPLGSTSLKVSSSIMLNLIGHSSSMSEIKKIVHVALAVPGASVHLYGKKECRKGRKMGHITLVGDSDATTRENLRPLLSALPSSTLSTSATSSLLSSTLSPPNSQLKYDVDLYAPLASRKGIDHPYPLVGIIMGSDSDLPIMRPAAEILTHFSIPHELSIVSAHRTPDRMMEYAKEAASRGIRVIIAGAGGAAHLPGMVAAITSLPVIGVPVKGSSLDGVDSLYSIVQMPVRVLALAWSWHSPCLLQ